MACSWAFWRGSWGDISERSKCWNECGGNCGRQGRAMRQGRKRTEWPLIWAICLWNVPQGVLHASEPVKTLASWYSTESCAYWEKRGRHDCPTASQKDLRWLEAHQPYFAASWDYQLGTWLQICTPDVPRPYHRLAQPHHLKANQPQACHVVEVTDRGPAKRLVKQGRRLDLSKASFQAVCGSLRQGVCEVEITEVPGKPVK